MVGNDAGVRGRDAGVVSCGKLGAGDSQTATFSLSVLGNVRFLLHRRLAAMHYCNGVLVT